MQVDALHALFGLHAKKPGLGRVQRELPLRHESQVGAADLELGPHDVERALTVGERLREDLLALAGGDLRGEGILDLAERAQADRRVRCDCLLLLGGSDFDLCFQRPAFVDRRHQVGAEVPDWIAAILENEQLARDRAGAGRQRDGREPGSFRFVDAVECCGHAPFGGPHVRSALEKLGRKSRRHRIRLAGQLRRDFGRGCGVPAEEDLQRANRLFARQLDLAQVVAVVSERGAGDVDILVVADANLRARLGQAYELLVVSNRPARDLGL